MKKLAHLATELLQQLIELVEDDLLLRAKSGITSERHCVHAGCNVNQLLHLKKLRY